MSSALHSARVSSPGSDAGSDEQVEGDYEMARQRRISENAALFEMTFANHPLAPNRPKKTPTKRVKTYKPLFDRDGYVISLPPPGGRQRFETVFLAAPRGFSPDNYIDLTGINPTPSQTPSPKKVVPKPARRVADVTATRQSETASSICHQCRCQSPKLKMACRNVDPMCPKVYCHLCIETYKTVEFSQYSTSFICPYCDKTCRCGACFRKSKSKSKVRNKPKPEEVFETVIVVHHANDKVSVDPSKGVKDKIAVKPKRRRRVVENSPPRKFRRMNPPPGATDLRIVRIKVPQTETTNVDEAVGASSDDEDYSSMSATPPPDIAVPPCVQTVVPSGSISPAVVADLTVTLPTMVAEPSWQTWETGLISENIEHVTEVVSRNFPWTELPFDTWTAEPVDTWNDPIDIPPLMTKPWEFSRCTSHIPLHGTRHQTEDRGERTAA